VSWHAWFKSAGLKLNREIVGTSFTDTNALMEAAVTGQGIALGRLSVTRSDILAGKLVRLSEHSLRVSYCHYAVYPISSESNPALVAFRDWLVEEALRTKGAKRTSLRCVAVVRTRPGKQSTLDLARRRRTPSTGLMIERPRRFGSATPRC
jgi:hypothetical protein